MLRNLYAREDELQVPGAAQVTAVATPFYENVLFDYERLSVLRISVSRVREASDEGASAIARALFLRLLLQGAV